MRLQMPMLNSGRVQGDFRYEAASSRFALFAPVAARPTRVMDGARGRAGEGSMKTDKEVGNRPTYLSIAFGRGR